MSVGLKLNFDDDGSLKILSRKINKLAQVDLTDLLELIGSEVEGQTRTRIQDEKKAPDGSEWADWSKEYAGSKHGRSGSHAPHKSSRRRAGGHTMLQLDGGLLDSIAFDVQAKEVLIGSNLVYAGAMNKQRPYLGIGSQNGDDIEKLAVEFFEETLR